MRRSRRWRLPFRCRGSPALQASANSASTNMRAPCSEVARPIPGSGPRRICLLHLCVDDLGKPQYFSRARRTRFRSDSFFIELENSWQQFVLSESCQKKMDIKTEQTHKTIENKWYSRPELNGNPRFRKPLLYPFELRERAFDGENTPAAANGKPMTLRGMTNFKIRMTKEFPNDPITNGPARCLFGLRASFVIMVSELVISHIHFAFPPPPFRLACRHVQASRPV